MDAGALFLCSQIVQCMSRFLHFATFGGTAKIGCHRGKADMAGPAVGSTRSRMRAEAA